MHKTVHRQVKDQLTNQVRGLGDRVAEYQKTYDQAPEDYVENTQFPNLKVPIGVGFYLPAKWIKHLDSGNITCCTLVVVHAWGITDVVT